MIFAPPTQMHLRNLIYTMIAWRDAEPLDGHLAKRQSVAVKTLKALKEAITAGQFNNLPKE